MLVCDTEQTVEKLIEGPGPHEMAWQEWPDVTPEDGEIDAFVATAQRAENALAKGASVWVETTRACVTVDVNTGSDTSPAAGLKANIDAARTLPRLLRIKGLGGQIVVDFAPAPKKDRRGIEAALRAAFRTCRVETALLGWPTLGHFEMTRKRARPALEDLRK